MAGVCLVSGGRGHLGSPTATATGDGTRVSTTLDTSAGMLTFGKTGTTQENIFLPPPPQITFSVDPNAAETATSVVNRLVNVIDADPGFIASMIGVGTTDFQVTQTGGAEVAHLLLSENDPGIREAAVSFDAPGRAWVAINRVLSVNGDGNYRLIIDFVSGTDYDQTFNTTSPPTNTIGGLTTAFEASLVAAGFCTYTDSGSGLKFISKPGVNILKATQSATDSAITAFTVDLTNNSRVDSCTGASGTGISNNAPAGGIPTLSEFGMFVLVALLTGAALLVLRRKGAHGAA